MVDYASSEISRKTLSTCSVLELEVFHVGLRGINHTFIGMIGVLYLEKVH